MNRQECDKLIESYVEWLRQGLSTAMIKDMLMKSGPQLVPPGVSSNSNNSVGIMSLLSLLK